MTAYECHISYRYSVMVTSVFLSHEIYNSCSFACLKRNLKTLFFVPFLKATSPSSPLRDCPLLRFSPLADLVHVIIIIINRFV